MEKHTNLEVCLELGEIHVLSFLNQDIDHTYLNDEIETTMTLQKLEIQWH